MWQEEKRNFFLKVGMTLSLVSRIFTYQCSKWDFLPKGKSLPLLFAHLLFLKERRAGRLACLTQAGWHVLTKQAGMCSLAGWHVLPKQAGMCCTNLNAGEVVGHHLGKANVADELEL